MCHYITCYTEKYFPLLKVLIIFYLQVVYIYYNPWEKHIRSTVEKETEFLARNFVRIDESSMCVVGYIFTVFFTIL